ncbi:MAG: T9SS C-terminal target domain-containing protein [Calditrichaeota bacterium]|nr:MAG: T9SS C-terminal target domain-containing protein [Calditrichota bacterium]MBL1206332.1 T9SS C-terminal target domain-containing protein [Calditrichota bacterium]NOG46158.1 T9SS type A sorting domain-containing protein [Calditrichota bacterium]
MEKSNQSQVLYHDNTWWGVFKAINNKWIIAELSGSSWSLNLETGIVGESSADAFVNESTDKLYMIVSKGSEQFTRLSYSGGSWTEDSGFPIAINLESVLGNDPACITQAADGDLFIFYCSSGSVKALYSSNDGVSWTTLTITTGVDASSITDAIAFDDQIGLFIGDGSSNQGFQFYRLPDTDSPTTPSNWISESLPTSGEDADDHVNIIRDASDNLYMIGKNKKSPPPYFYLYKRNSNATWESYEVDGLGATRPALALNGDTQTLIIGAKNDGIIEYVLLDKDNLSNVSSSDWVPVLQNNGDAFNNVSLSYQILSNTSDVVFVAENTSAGTIWFNTLDNPDQSLPVELSSFNAKVEKDKIVLNWVTQSELNNAFFILERATENLVYEEIAKIQGKGNSSVISNYSFSDTDVEESRVYYYRLSEQALDGQVSLLRVLEISTNPFPPTAVLSQNYPNPFNPQTVINYYIPAKSHVKMELFNESGQKVRVLVNQQQAQGAYSITFNAGSLSSGIYFYRLLTSSGFTQTKKLHLVR